jgi:uncharacterized Fe-S cluster-containing radical SAM superfamily protein
MSKLNDTQSSQPHFYQNHLTPGFKPFDPLELASVVEKAVCQGNRRRYSRFGYTLNYKTGIATGYAVGCVLRCIYCWADRSRDKFSKTYQFYSPQEVFDELKTIAKQRNLDLIRTSDGEPTIGKTHLIELLELVEHSNFRKFILETNGILLGHDKEYAKSLSKFQKLSVRVSLKAGTPEDFTRKTGAKPEAFELPFQAIKNLKSEGCSFTVAAMSADPRFMTPIERIYLIAKLAAIDPHLVLNLEEETAVLYPTTLKRLKAIGWETRVSKQNIFHKIPLLRKFIQVSYIPIAQLGMQKISKKRSIKAILELLHGT